VIVEGPDYLAQRPKMRSSAQTLTVLSESDTQNANARPRTKEREMSYRMRGRFLEACDRYVACPCWFEEDPDEAECSGVVAWQIEQGTVDAVEVSGLHTASVSRHEGHRGRPKRVHIALFIDKRADGDQYAALEAAFTGRLGGPLGELAELFPNVGAVEKAGIAFNTDGAKAALSVGQAVTVRAKLLTGATGRVISVGDGVLSRLLGTPGDVGKSTGLRLDIEGRLVDVSDRSATSGRFAYVHDD
jgi:hypothetical protein